MDRVIPLRVIALGLFALFLSACAGSVQATTVPAVATNPPAATGLTSGAVPVSVSGTPEPAAAIINNKVRISVADLDKEVNRRLEARKSVGDAVPADAKAFRDTVLDSLIEQALINEAAIVQGIKVTDQEVDAEIADLIKSAGSKDKWLAQVAADKMTEAEYRDGLREALVTNKMRDIVTANVGTTAEQVHARHILVADEATANKLLQQLKGGADFAKLAAQSSLDMTTKQTGGDLGWFPRGQLLQKSVEDAAFSLATNDFSTPVKSDLGYHIIQTIERSKDRPVDPYIRSQLTERAFEDWLQALVKKAQIVKYPRP